MIEILEDGSQKTGENLAKSSLKNQIMKLNTVAPERASEKERPLIEKLWADFLGDYNAYKSNKMQLKDELKYSLFCVPGPSQYRAFSDFFDFFEYEEHTVEALDAKKYLYMYDCLSMDEQAVPPTLQFLTNLASPVYDAKGKKIVLASGSFWKQHLSTREKMIYLLNELDAQGADVYIHTQANEDEACMCNIKQSVKEKSNFALQKRIAIHYIQADKDCILQEFPHTEITEFRLNWFLNFDNMNLKQGKTKDGLLYYFDSLIRSAL